MAKRIEGYHVTCALSSKNGIRGTLPSFSAPVGVGSILDLRGMNSLVSDLDYFVENHKVILKHAKVAIVQREAELEYNRSGKIPLEVLRRAIGFRKIDYIAAASNVSTEEGADYVPLADVADCLMDGIDDELEIRYAIDAAQHGVGVYYATLTQEKIIELQNYAKNKGILLTFHGTTKKYGVPKMGIEKEFDMDMRETIKELNELRKRVSKLIDNPETPGIEGVIDFDFMLDFIMGISKEVMQKESEFEEKVFDEARDYLELLEW